jgi:hypothetical protein
MLWNNKERYHFFKTKKVSKREAKESIKKKKEKRDWEFICLTLKSTCPMLRETFSAPLVKIPSKNPVVSIPHWIARTPTMKLSVRAEKP